VLVEIRVIDVTYAWFKHHHPGMISMLKECMNERRIQTPATPL
jgi:hypothetical protein